MGLETSEYTESRVHLTGLTEGVSDVPGYIWRPLARYSDFRSDRETTKSSGETTKLCEDLCLGTLNY